MGTNIEAVELRQRAGKLRELASVIDKTPAMELDVHASDDTWRGRKPTLCRAILAANQHQMFLAAEDLRWQAYLYEQEATAVEVSVRRSTGLTGLTA